MNRHLRATAGAIIESVLITTRGQHQVIRYNIVGHSKGQLFFALYSSTIAGSKPSRRRPGPWYKALPAI